jgi:hypothetical protein
MTTTVHVNRDLTLAYVASGAVALAIMVAGLAGLVSDPAVFYAGSSLVLVSQGADLANLVIVLPLLLAFMWLARRGSLIGLLLWPGLLFYVAYAYIPYLVGAPLNALFFAYATLVTVSGFTVIGIVASLDAEAIRARLADVPARGIGAALVVIAVSAYAGLAGTAMSQLGSAAGDASTRPLAVADWALGSPVLLIGGVLLWRRLPLGYVAGAGLLLVSGLGGVAFAVAAVVDNMAGAPVTESAVIAVHLVISAVSLALLAVFVVRAMAPRRITRHGWRAASGDLV